MLKLLLESTNHNRTKWTAQETIWVLMVELMEIGNNYFRIRKISKIIGG